MEREEGKEGGRQKRRKDGGMEEEVGRKEGRGKEAEKNENTIF